MSETKIWRTTSRVLFWFRTWARKSIWGERVGLPDSPQHLSVLTRYPLAFSTVSWPINYSSSIAGIANQ
jgi:hypothetical protein